MGTSTRGLHLLSAAKVSKLIGDGRYGDGGGLYLQVKKGARSWIFRYMLNKKSRDMGLGAYPAVSLSQAREQAAQARILLAQEKDPLEERKRFKEHRQAVQDIAPVLTFSAAAEEYIKIQRAGWSNEKHAAQWTATMRDYAEKVFGQVPVSNVTTDQVLKVLQPIWSEKTETATRVRSRIENILDWANAKGLRTGPNPARWRGHLEQILPPPNRVSTVEHHTALPFNRMSNFLKSLRTHVGVSAVALEFTILTACRTGEVIGARKSEFDFPNATWTIPAARMKANKEHRVALGPRALYLAELLISEIPDGDAQQFLFTGPRRKLAAGRHSLSNMAMLELVKGMRVEFGSITVHGFRSAFRDWAAETTEYAGEVVEAALAHTVKNKVEAAYRRGDLLDRRRPLMRDWEEYCLGSATQTALQEQSHQVNVP